METESGKSIGDFGLGMNPEFLREMREDFQNPDRIAFGFEDEKTLIISDKSISPGIVKKLK